LINLRTLEIEIPKDVELLLLHLHGHTGKMEITALNFPIYEFRDVPHTWRGEIDRVNKTFRIIRGSEGIWSPPLTVVKAEITGHKKKTFLKIKLQPTGRVFFNNAALIIITIIATVFIPNDILFANWWIAILWLLALTLNFVHLAADLNKTTKKLIQYFRAQTDGA
jgi:hypothetical protein